MTAAPTGWDPGPRPAWVQHVLDGEGGPVYDLARQPFDAEQLQAEAAARAGLDDFGTDSHVEPLRILASSLDDEADLHLVGRWRVREVIVRSLENRLRLVEAVRRDPDIGAEPIERPIIVTGSPRAGTSILHQLLGEDPASRIPLAWEYWCPAPCPTPATWATDARIPLANRDVRLSALLAPTFDGMHEQGALLPREDGSAMLVDVRGDPVVAHYPVTSYAAWFHEADHTTAYEWWRLTLQVLQRNFPDKRRWVTKMPGHMAVLPTLLRTFPDALVVVCHRDPLEMLSSVTSLLATLRWAHANTVDYHSLAREQADYYHRILDRLAGFCREGVLDPARTVHVRFGEFNADQPGTIARIYEHLDVTPPDDLADRLAAYLDARPRGRHGGHQHRWADLGLDLDAERARFRPYQDYFAIPDEEIA